MKRTIAAILAVALTMSQLSATQPQATKQDSENEFGIDLTKTYSGEEVNDIINIILEESDTAIDEATKHGYEIAAEERDELQQKYDRQKKNCWLYFAGGILAGALFTGGIVWLKK